MRKLFKLKTILTIVLLIIAICTQVSNVFGYETSDIVPYGIETTSNLFWEDEDYSYQYTGCGEKNTVPNYAELIGNNNYYITDFYGSDSSNRHKNMIYTKLLYVTDGNFIIKDNTSENYDPFLISVENSTFQKTYLLQYAYSISSVNKSCSYLDEYSTVKSGQWVEGKNNNLVYFETLSSIKKHVRSNQTIMYKDNVIVDDSSISAKGDYYTSIENSKNEITEIGWKDKEYFMLGSFPSYKYIHISKQLNVTKDEYFQFLFRGNFYGVDNKAKIMNISIRLYDDEGNSSDIIPVDFSYSKDGGIVIKQKVSKSPINASNIELILSLKDEHTSGSYGHMINEFDIASDSSGETNSWLGGIFDSITKLPELIVEGLSSLFQGIIDAVVGLGKFIVDGIVSFLQLIIDGIVALGTMIVDALQFVIDGLISLGTFIIDGLKSLFIPSDDFFSKYFSDLYEFFSNKLGILLAPFDVLITIVQKFLNISEGSGVLVIPNITILSYQLISAQSFDLKGFFSTVLGNNYNLYYAFVDCILAVMLMRLAMKKFNSIVGGGTSNDN